MRCILIKTLSELIYTISMKINFFLVFIGYLVSCISICIDINPTRGTIVRFMHDMCEYTTRGKFFSFNIFILRVPHKFKLFVFFAFILIIIIYFSKEYCFETHFCKQFWCCGRMTKLVWMPGNSGSYIKFLS
jgi:hypothetical protein